MAQTFSSLPIWNRLQKWEYFLSFSCLVGGVLHVELERLWLFTVSLQWDIHEAGVGKVGSVQQNLGSVAEPWKHTIETGGFGIRSGLISVGYQEGYRLYKKSVLVRWCKEETICSLLTLSMSRLFCSGPTACNGFAQWGKSEICVQLTILFYLHSITQPRKFKPFIMIQKWMLRQH